jgi:hypothetical protein
VSNIYTARAIPYTTTVPSIYEGRYHRFSYMVGSFARQMSITISLCVLLFNIAVQCRPTSDREESSENRYDDIIDDIKWLAVIVFIVVITAALYCLSGSDTQAKPNRECCSSDKPQVIHVHIDPCDAVTNHRSYHPRPTRDPNFPSAPDEYT